MVIIVEEKKINKKYIILGVICIVVSVMLIVILSTYVRWINEKKDLFEVQSYKIEDNIVYEYNDNTIHVVNEIVDFYDDKVELSFDKNQYITLYCDKDDNCKYIEESIFKNPGLLIFINILILLIVFYLIIKDITINKIIKIVISFTILLSGLYLILLEIMNYADYYVLVNNNNNISEGIIAGYNNKHDIIKYVVDNNEYIITNKSKDTHDIDSNVTVYYNAKKPGVSDVKRDYIISLKIVYGIVLIIVSLFYFKINKKDK